jgi:hypothetical protein
MNRTTPAMLESIAGTMVTLGPFSVENIKAINQQAVVTAPHRKNRSRLADSFSIIKNSMKNLLICQEIKAALQSGGTFSRLYPITLLDVAIPAH